MNRKVEILLIALAAVLGTGLCIWLAGHQPAAPATGPVREITDMTGRTAKVPVDPRRVLSLCTSATDTIVRLGLTDRLAAIDEHSRIVPGSETATVIGKGSAISKEQVLSLGIDMALVWWYQDDAAAMLDELSVPVVRICCCRMAEVPGMIRLIGECMNRRPAADKLAGKVKAYLPATDTPLARAGPRVYLELYGPFKTVGRDSYINDILELAGGKNIAGDVDGSVLLSPERLIQADPDMILFMDEFTTAAAIAARSGMAELRAVRTGNVHPIERYWLVPGGGLPVAVDKLRTVLKGDR